MDPANKEMSGDGDLAANRAAPIARRVLIIGLDGATLDVLRPLMEEGRLPRLSDVVERGASGVLHSTTPPITPAAWTTFLTGRQPGSHGIIDFERFDPHTNRLTFNSTLSIAHVRNLWTILGEHNLKVGSIGVPMTFPATPINGFLVSGFETPGVDSNFVFPAALKDVILARWPDPILKTSWKRRLLGGNRLFARNVDYMARSFHQCAEMTTFLGDRQGWDVLMVVLKLVDNLQHKTWKHIDPRWRDDNPTRRDIVKACFAEMDAAVGTLLDYARRHEAAVLIVSDHGHGSLEGKIQPNLLLKRWGYLTLVGGGSQAATTGRHRWDRLRGRTKRFAREGDVTHDLAVDFSRTRACVMHAGMAGFLYVNLAGRQPTGIVSPEDYEALREELRDRFLGSECQTMTPDGLAVRLFSAVHKPEELWNCRREAQPWMPDLILMPHASLAVVRRIRGQSPIHWLPDRRIEGTHRPEGVFFALGPGIAVRRDVDAGLADCAPTVLAMLGLPVPEDMEGRVLSELFQGPLAVKRAAAAQVESPASVRLDAAAPAYSEAELQRVTERLSDLGYLE